MNNRQTVTALVTELNKYPMNQGEKIPWVYEKVIDEKRQLPFFSWTIANAHQRITFKHVGEPFIKVIQLKVHCDDPLEASDRIEWLQNVLGSMQPQVDLAQQGISIVEVSDPEPLDEDWTIAVENQVGVTVTLMINPDYRDQTQVGELDSVEPNIKITKEES
ncbi:LIC_12616 family protein [Levilactobacillus brevis]|nr:hypothetical protein [Levilactobacillus brevis]RWZ41056.1 hypothetical protein EQG69_04810 [Levilactobacillus brevis]